MSEPGPTTSSPVLPTSLTALERDVLAVMAVTHEPLNRTALSALLRAAQVRSERARQLSASDLAPLLQSFEQQGLVKQPTEAEYLLLPSVAHALMMELSSSSRLLALIQAVRGERPVEKYGYWVEEGAAARELWLSLYLCQPPAIARFTADSELARRLWRRALGTEPSHDILARLPGPALVVYLDETLIEAEHELFRLSAALYTRALAEAAQLSNEANAALCVVAALRGEAQRGLEVTHDRSDAQVVAARAFAYLSLEQYDEARGESLRALELTITRSSGRFKGLRGPISRWVNLLLLSGESPRGHELARAQLASKWAVSHDRYLTLAAHALDAHRNGARERPELRSDFEMIDAHFCPHDWASLLAWTLMRRLRDKELGRVERAQLKAHAAQASADDYGWLATELLRLEAGGPAAASRLARSSEPWERHLRGLEAALDDLDRASKTQKQTERLVWSLVVQGSSHQLSARVQVKTQGGYSSGRQVSWKTLLEGQHAPWMTPEDEHALKIIAVEATRDRYGSTSYTISREAPLGLIGHPRVFGDHECKEPITVLRGSPRIDVETHGHELSVQMVPHGLSRDGMLCVREGHDRVLIYALSPQQTGLAALLDKPLKLPAEARERSHSLLSRLIDHFPVAADLELHEHTDAVEEIAADARPCIDLRPMPQGLSVRVSVAPLGEGQSFVPGQGPASTFAKLEREGARITVRCVRDLADERAKLETLLDACPELTCAEEGQPLVLTDRSACLELLLSLSGLGEQIRVRWPEGQPLRVLAEVGAARLSVRVLSHKEWLSAEGELEVDAGLKIGLRELLGKLSTRSGRFIELGDGQFVALTHDLERKLEALASTTDEREEKLLVHPLVSDVLFASEDLGQLESDRTVKKRLQKLEAARTASFSVPRGFEAELRAYQVEGFTWLSRLGMWGAGACLADDMGLGKTLQALAFLLAQAEHGPSLVIAPMSVCENWMSEAKRFAPGLRMLMLADHDRTAVLAEAKPFDVIVASYGLLQQEIEALVKIRFQVVVLDEAQAIKNAQTQRARAAFRLVGTHKLALTGTPVENHLGELWSIFAFLNPGLLGSAKAFEARFAKPIQRDGDERAARSLRRLIKPFVLRRKKSEVLDDLPPKTEITLRIEPSSEELALYEALREEALTRLADPTRAQEQRIRVLAEIMKLRRAACHPQLVAPALGLASTKLETFEALVAELAGGGHRALVFSQFVDHLALVRARLDALDIPYQYLDGSTARGARTKAVEAFQRGEGTVFLISLKAGGFGLNLASADYVIHLDPWWNPAVEDQASDRAHRIGQTRPVTVYRLVMRSSIEEKIVRLHHDKRELSDSLLDGTSQGGTLSVEQLMALLHEERPREARALAADAPWGKRRRPRPELGNEPA